MVTLAPTGRQQVPAKLPACRLFPGWGRGMQRENNNKQNVHCCVRPLGEGRGWECPWVGVGNRWEPGTGRLGELQQRPLPGKGLSPDPWGMGARSPNLTPSQSLWVLHILNASPPSLPPTISLKYFPETSMFPYRPRPVLQIKN
uniref:Uncharacterized protein n=1 Tax=Myotis myotis TaxID=51298 RepID=A0A7J7Z5I0_MYOMY|nr:hypothetical protein mMyoMyo1_010778 [Myotis myotis]